MANLRIVYDNAADRATVTASSTAGSLGTANLKTNTKSEVWRSTAASATLKAEWSEPEVVGCVALPFCSLTSTATIRVRGYTNADDVTALFDTGEKLACPYAPFGSWDWGLQPLGVNAYSFADSAYGVIWFERLPVRKLVIDIQDADSTLGYIEASRLVAGSYWSPQYNATGEPQLTPYDTSKHERSDAGDLKTDIGIKYNGLTFDLGVLAPVDRDRVWQILKANGMSRPVFVSLSPQSGDVMQEQMYQLYGKLTRTSALTYKFMGRHATQLELEEV